MDEYDEYDVHWPADECSSTQVCSAVGSAAGTCVDPVAAGAACSSTTGMQTFSASKQVLLATCVHASALHTLRASYPESIPYCWPMTVVQTHA